MSCKCQKCKKRYKVDVLVENALWEKIKPRGKAPGGGLLCGSCILVEIEKMDKYQAFRLKGIA